MTVIIFFYMLGMVLTALFIRNSNKELVNKLEEKNALLGAILLWPLFLIMYFINWCENIAKKVK